MKALRTVVGAAMAIGLLLVCFFGSFRMVVFNRAYMNRELEKLRIAESVSMTQDDLRQVFDEILCYLEGKRKDLVILTTVAGEAREAFNDREKAHMEDVSGLFEGGFQLYYAGMIAVAAALGFVIFCRKERRATARICGKSVVIVFSVFFLLMAILAVLLAIDFNYYFVIFHKIFFNNDLWLLDPRTDLMINLVPEQFFFDTAMTIGGIFLGVSVLILGGAVWLWRRLAGTERHEK